MPGARRPRQGDRGIGPVVVLCALTVLLWIGAGAIVPLLPTYLHHTGSSPAVVGSVMASYFVLAVLIQYPVGRLSDRVGSRLVISGGLLLFMLGSAGFLAAKAPIAAIGCRALQGAGAGAVGVAASATVARAVAPSSHGRAYGLLAASQNLALAIGPLLGGVLGASSVRTLFVAAIGLAAVGVALSVLGLPAGGTTEHQVPIAYPSSGTGRYRRALLGGVLVLATSGLLTGLYESCWSLLLADRGAGSIAIGLSWTLYSVPYTGLSNVAGRLADRLDRRGLVVAGITTSAGFAVTYPLLRSVDVLVGLGCAEAVGAVLVTPAALAMVSRFTPAGRHGAAQGTLGTAKTAATALAAAGCGALYGLSIPLPFLVVAGSLLLLAAGAARCWAGLGSPGADVEAATDRPLRFLSTARSR